MTEHKKPSNLPADETLLSPTYASLLETDVHPALRPHIERLAEEQADASGVLADASDAPHTMDKIVGIVAESPPPQTPETAISEVAAMLSMVGSRELQHAAKPLFLRDITERLRIVASKEDTRQTRDLMGNNDQFQKLGIRNGRLIKNSTDRALHGRVLAYLESVGLPTTEADRIHIKAFFEAEDRERKSEALRSFAHHGLLTLSSAMRKGLVQETSSTPGDYASMENIMEIDDADSAASVRGYIVGPDATNELFYGRNSFFQVVTERGGEEIDRAMTLPKDEVENRVRSSILFAARSGKLPLSLRTDNKHDEDIVRQDIPPEAIDFALVAEENYAVTKEAFAHLPVHVVSVSSTMAELEGFADNPYRVPDYKKALQYITDTQGPVWCHISRLPVDTYPDASK
jgi:hypothetical protein